MQIEFVVFGDVTPDLAQSMAAKTAGVLGAPCSVNSQPLAVPDDAYHPQRGQYEASVLLGALRRGTTSQTAYVLGIADVDLFARGLSFVFGQAELGGNAAVMSLTRLRPEFWGQTPDYALFLERAVKEAVHELGHVIGLRHCPNPVCVMHFSNSLADTDRKGQRFCDRYAARVWRQPLV